MDVRRIVSCTLILTISLHVLGCTSGSKVQAPPQQEAVETGNTQDKSLNDNGKTADAEVQIGLPYSAAIYQALVKPYNVSGDLSNIENIYQFGDFTKEQAEMLSQNAFFVYPSSYNQLFYIYEKNAQLGVPNYISSDSVLQMYSVLSGSWQRSADEDKLIKVLEDLTESMLNKSIYLYYSVKSQELKPYIINNIAYFAVSQLALKRSLPRDIPSYAKDLAEREYQLIQYGSGYRKSELFPYKIDYRKFHQDGCNDSDTYKRYFQAMTWYSEAYFPLYGGNAKIPEDKEQTLQALLIIYCMFMDNDDNDALMWKKLYDINELCNGKTGGPAVYEYKDLLYKVYGDTPDVEELNDMGRLDNFCKEAEKLPEAESGSKITSQGSDDGIHFRLIGGQYMPDSNIMPQLVDKTKRPVPSGTDVMGVLGSDRAYEISMKDNTWREYPNIFETLRADYMKLPDSTWRSYMQYGWLWCLKSLNITYGSGYPSFMANDAWKDKSLNAALSGWALMKCNNTQFEKQHDTGAAANKQPANLGYVEPCIETYSRVLWLTRYLRENLKKRELLPDDVKSSIESFETLVDFLINCSVKELKNEKLTDDEYSNITSFGSSMKKLLSGTIPYDEYEQNKAAKTLTAMAAVTNIYTNPRNNSQLQAGVGPAHEIYVVVPIAGKLYLTRGAAFGYYEFINNSGQSLSINEWRSMIDGNGLPDSPWWTESFITDGVLSSTRAATP